MINNPSSNKLVDIHKLSFSYESKKIFQELSLSIEKGSITSIIGQSGIGKTTLLKLIAGIYKPDSGSIEVFQKKIGNISSKELFKIRKKMGLLFQSGALFSDYSVYENVAYPLKEIMNDKDVIDLKVKEILSSVGLEFAAQKYPSELSGGMHRRVALARALVTRPSLMMYDEPFVGQDPITKSSLLDLIKKFNKKYSITSIIVSHDVAEVMSLSDKVCMVYQNEIIASGTPCELKQSNNPIVKQFLTGSIDGPIPLNYS